MPEGPELGLRRRRHRPHPRRRDQSRRRHRSQLPHARLRLDVRRRDRPVLASACSSPLEPGASAERVARDVTLLGPSRPSRRPSARTCSGTRPTPPSSAMATGLRDRGARRRPRGGARSSWRRRSAAPPPIGWATTRRSEPWGQRGPGCSLQLGLPSALAAGVGMAAGGGAERRGLPVRALGPGAPSRAGPRRAGRPPVLAIGIIGATRAPRRRHRARGPGGLQRDAATPTRRGGRDQRRRVEGRRPRCLRLRGGRAATGPGAGAGRPRDARGHRGGGRGPRRDRRDGHRRLREQPAPRRHDAIGVRLGVRRCPGRQSTTATTWVRTDAAGRRPSPRTRRSRPWPRS